MGKLTQKELVNSRLYEEGIRSMLRKAAQTGLERAVKVGKGIGTAMAPKTSEALGKLGQAVSSFKITTLTYNLKVSTLTLKHLMRLLIKPVTSA